MTTTAVRLATPDEAYAAVRIHSEAGVATGVIESDNGAVIVYRPFTLGRVWAPITIPTASVTKVEPASIGMADLPEGEF